MGNASHIKKKRGPAKGSTHSGMFKTGPDARRYKHDEERRKARLTVEELAKEYTAEAFEKLANLLESDNPKMVLEAATQILDRGHGKAVDRVAIQTIGTGQGSIADADPDTLIRLLESRTGALLEHDCDT